MRRIDLWPVWRPRYDIVRRMRALRRRVDRLAADFDWSRCEGPGYWNWKLPLPSHPIEGASARQAVQASVAQLLIDTAHRLIARRPADLRYAKVVVVISLPDMFASEICVFFDEAYRASFVDRQGDEETWTPANDSLVERWKLKVGKGFGELGFDYVRRDLDFDPAWVQAGQVWMIGEV